MVTNGLHILGVLLGFHDFTMHFLDEVLFQDMTHIDDIFFLGDPKVAFICGSLTFLSHTDGIFFLFPPVFWQVSTRELCRYVRTLWVQGRGSLFKAL